MIGEAWKNVSENSCYPFSDGVTLTADTSQELDRGTFLDAAVCLVGGTAPLYLSQINVTAQTVTFWIGDALERLLASGTYTFADDNAVIELTDIAGRPAGILLSEPQRLARFTGWESGSHSFDLTATEFVPRATMCPPIQGVSELTDNSGVAVSGEVWLVGDDGVVLREQGGKIRVDIVGDPLFRRRLCGADGSIESRRFAKAFAGLLPNSMGEIALTVNEHEKGSVLRIQSDSGGIKISLVGG